MEDMLIAKITKPKLEELRELLQRVTESKDEE
jgi:hypothetical protein